MGDFYWVLHDLSGTDLRSTERFADKEEAEAWMGREWSGLLDEGAESVTLFEGDSKHYRMGLRPA
jgi:hypothetical protein